MAEMVSWQDFYRSGQVFAQDAMEAHHQQQFGRSSLYAGTALEHLMKSCLVKRSPALIVQLGNERNFLVLVRLLGIPHLKASAPPLRTVGLREALDRVANFVDLKAPKSDLETLIGLRDGTVHAAEDTVLEERVLVAFAKQSDALVADLGNERGDFWGAHLAVVDALLADAKDRIEHQVAVKLAAARASFDRRHGQLPTEILEFIRQSAGPMRHSFFDEERATCPACGSFGIAYGDAEPEWGAEDSDGRHRVEFICWEAGSFTCRVCGLDLESPEELIAAGMPIRWKVEGAHYSEYWPGVSEEELYEEWSKFGAE